MTDGLHITIDHLTGKNNMKFHRKATLYPFLCLLLFVAGCADQKIDGSSREAFESSLREVQSSLGDDERETFDQSVAKTLVSRNMVKMLGAAMSGQEPDITDENFITDEFLKDVDGKTAAEIIELAKGVGPPVPAK